MSTIRQLINEKFELLYLFTLLWFASGIFLDAWAHSFFGSELETFFTPWHFVLYSGFSSILGLLLIVPTFNYLLTRKQHPQASFLDQLKNSVPTGYYFAYVGLLFFILGGMGDFIWHALFGFEASVEALYSPTHLSLGLGMLMIWSSPLIATWKKEEIIKLTWKNNYIVFFSSTFLLFIFTFFTAVYNPFMVPIASVKYQPPLATTAAHVDTTAIADQVTMFYQALGISAIIVSSIIISGILLPLIKRFQLPKGWLFLMITSYGVITSLINATYFVIIPALIGGICSEIGYAFLVKNHQANTIHSRNIRIYSVLLTFPLFLTYFIVIVLLESTWWTIHLWLGAPFLAGIVSLLVSYLIFPMSSNNN